MVIMSAPRSLCLPDDVPGKVWLHSMPGRREPFEEFVAWAESEGVSLVACLNPHWELEQASRAYACALEDGTVPWRTLHHPIANMGVPDDPAAFADVVEEAARCLREGGGLVIHCAFGIGRTGLMAAALLMELGCGLAEACAHVARAGSNAETREQRHLLEEIARKGSRG